MKALISASLLPETATSFAITTCAIDSLFFSACASSSFIVAYGYFGCPFFGGCVSLPLDEAAADRVVLLLVEHRVAGHQLAGHRVRVREVALRRVVDDVLRARR